ncbi:hypothetical protein DAPPUDRAFT_265147 [Daphnia pulex]|uniref:Uncharacterized protein n=1 Tax=Daphnia pulex TaxID=6669 RepID=E9HSX3_DAPPU|nr:hypothetical protein DAPPUDRAFT_265147 [Daphnia pulex]|eukprot:EFX65155.1 hypothetical protein DAPPUDRAFT_265147 [Daphnia pulex]
MAEKKKTASGGRFVDLKRKKKAYWRLARRFDEEENQRTERRKKMARWRLARQYDEEEEVLLGAGSSV